MTTETYSLAYLTEMQTIAASIDVGAVERLVDLLVAVRERGGRLFFLGVGGGAGNSSHAVCDFRKLAGFEAYAPTDNVSELTAWINDDGWEGSLASWLRESRLRAEDMLFVFSVGGGDRERNVSANLVQAMEYGQHVGAALAGVVGRDGGYTARLADACIIVPTVNPSTVTPHTESFQVAIWHLLVTHPRLQAAAAKWESLVGPATV